MQAFEDLSDQSKVWIYQTNRRLTTSEQTSIKEKLDEFIPDWIAHGKNLKASSDILYDHFIILMVDESAASASGCSIDASVHFLKDIEKDFNVILFDRLLFAFKQDDEVKVVNKNTFKELISDNQINNETLVFNNLVNTKKELNENWLIPLRTSWHKDAL